MKFTSTRANTEHDSLPCILRGLAPDGMREVPVLGKKTAISMPGTSAKPAIAAEPVSPDVAVTIMMRSAPPSLAEVRAIRRGSICRATSLKALVGPPKSSIT